MTENFEEWEKEQKRLDREWYGLDEGYDDDKNPFSGVSEEYTKRKEEALGKKGDHLTFPFLYVVLRIMHQ